VRVDGADRFATARATIRSAFTTAPVLFVVDSNAWTDAIVAGNVAAFNGEPVLIVNGLNGTVDAADATLIHELNTTTIRVIGGPAAVSDAMVNSFASLVPNTARVSGDDRFETASLLAQRTYAAPSTAYIVTGINYPDGLMAAGFSGRSGSPILLARTTCLPQPALEAIYKLNVSKVVLVGGTAALTDDVASMKPCGA
jgi:putative cell wall-binding protein